MNHPTTRRGSRLLLKFLPIVLFAVAVLLSRSAPTRPPNDSVATTTATVSLRAIGAVHPRLSPDGKTIVFSYQGNIWRIASEGGTMRRLAAGTGFAVEPCWSPDGKRIAFLQSRNWGSGALTLIDAQTGAAVPLAREIVGTGKLFFSADGQRILGHLRRQKQLDALRALDLKTGELTTILPQRSPRQPWALSHDSKWIVHVTTMDVPDEQAGNFGPLADVWKVPVAGGDPQPIVRFPARIHDLCWSADGKSLIVCSELGGAHHDLWRLDLNDPEHPIKITFGQADESRPSLAEDGRWLLYTDNREGCPALVLHDLSSGELRPLRIQGLDFGVPTGRVRLKTVDQGTKKPVVARVALEHKDGSFHAPPAALWRVNRDHAHFFVDGGVEFEVPAGPYQLRVFHGPEYRVVHHPLEIKAGQTTEQAVSLERWTNPNSTHWYSGDNHIHANYGYGEYYNSPAAMAQMCAGEGLNVGNFMVANSDGDGVFDREFFRGRPDPLSSERNILYWNEEFRSTIWGHMTLVNLKQVVEPVFTGFKDTTNPYDIPSMSEIAERTHRQGGVVNYTHPSARIDDLYRGAYTAKGLPVYAALGKIDTMDVMGSNDRASTALYHRLLNCGLRLTASAGTDCFLNRIRSRLPGVQRVYVKTDGPLTYTKWIDGLLAGRSFVSNTPILELTAEKKSLGEVLNLRSPRKVQVRGSVASPYPLDKIDVLFNGKVVHTTSSTKGKVLTELDQSIPIEYSGWLALRVSGPAHADVEGDSVYAHASPIYVMVAGKPAGAAEDARYFLTWIDQLWTAVQDRDRIPTPRRKAEVQVQIEEARATYQKIIDRP